MKTGRSKAQSGNMLIYILGAIFLLGLLVVLVKGSFQEGTGIDNDKLVVSATQVRQYGSELERGIGYILRNNYSESDLRFVNPSSVTGTPYGTFTSLPERQVFSVSGGGVEYKNPQAGINDATPWQFYATTHLTQLGTGGALRKAELIAVLPHVTLQFCSQINRMANQTIDLTLVTDPAGNGCVYASGSEFAGTFLTGAAVNLLDDTRLSRIPAKEACVRCNDSTYNYYRVLMAR